MRTFVNLTSDDLDQWEEDALAQGERPADYIYRLLRDATRQ